MSTPTRIWKALVKAVSYGPGANIKITQLTARIDELVDKVNSRNERISDFQKRLWKAEELHHIQLKKIAELENDNEQLQNERDAAWAEIGELKQHAAVPELTRHDVDDGPYAEQLTLDDLKGFVGEDAKKVGDGKKCYPTVSVSGSDFNRLRHQHGSLELAHAHGFNVMPFRNSNDGSMILWAGTSELRRHNPGDKMYWRDNDAQ